MKTNPLKTLESFDQSIWTDFINWKMIEGGGLQRLIREDGVSGVTSNPSIFEKAIAESHDYDASIRELAEQGKSAENIYEILTVQEIQHTADLLRQTYDRLHGADGFVSIEVSPRLANDTAGTIEEARRLWMKVDRPNVMIKVPGTKAGLPAIRQLTSDGINVNITLLFGLPRYREVVDAYLAGLEARTASKKGINTVSSVASFFLSRIDVLLDPTLESKARIKGGDGELAASLKGNAAIASAKIAYEIYRETFTDGRFKMLEAQGARKQRLLWASTSTKNPDYSDVKYVEPLIGGETINTLPLETLNAYRDHGNPRLTLTEGLDEARENLKDLKKLDIDIDKITDKLEREGVEKFIKAYDVLLNAIRQKASALVEKGVA